MTIRIKEARKAAGLTQSELAEKLGVNRATVSKYESGDIDISIRQLARIAEILGVPVQDLMAGNADEETDDFREWEMEISTVALWDRELKILIAALLEYIDRGNHSQNETYVAESVLAKARYAKPTRYP